MKRIGITVALLFCMGTGSLFAQAYKVVEKSDKKAPVWYESAESGYIVASAETGSMEERVSNAWKACRDRLFKLWHRMSSSRIRIQ